VGGRGFSAGHRPSIDRRSSDLILFTETFAAVGRLFSCFGKQLSLLSSFSGGQGGGQLSGVYNTDCPVGRCVCSSPLDDSLWYRPRSVYSFFFDGFCFDGRRSFDTTPDALCRNWCRCNISPHPLQPQKNILDHCEKIRASFK